MRHMLGNLSPNYFERTKRYMMLRASQQGTDLTVSGTPPLSLPNSLGKPLKAWEVDVLPKQDLNGYDAPWPAGGGKNLCPDAWVNMAGYWYNKRDDNTRLGLSELIKVTPSATYTISRNSGTLRYAIQQYANTDESVDTNPCINDTSWISNSSYTLTMSATTNYIWVCMSYSAFSRVTPAEGVSAKVQIEAGSSATSFAPYENLCPIYGTNKLNMFVEDSYDQSATPKAVITLSQTVYTGTIGSEGGESRMIEKIFSGADSIRILNSAQYVGANSTHFYIPAINPAINTTLTGNLCNMAIGGTCNAQNATYDNHFSRDGDSIFHFQFSNTVLGIDAEDDINTRISKISTWLSTADLRVVYFLQTPTEFALTVPPIPTPSGTATTWATAEDGTVDSMEVTYVGKA